MRTALVMALVMTSLGCEELFDNGGVADPHDAIPPVAGTDSDPRALTAYDDVLAGYGTWSEDDTYGTVWTPSDPTFVPYATHGRFVSLDGNVVWLSELPWGGATLHHGRWVMFGGRWHWVPGPRYGGAWVTWSHEGNATSWAPTPPTLAWRDGVAVRIDPRQAPIVGTAEDAALDVHQVIDEDESDFVRRWLAPPRGGW